MANGFLTNDEIKKWCDDCPSLLWTVSESGKHYYRCNKYHRPVFMVFNQCHIETHETELSALQKTLTDFDGGE